MGAPAFAQDVPATAPQDQATAPQDQSAPQPYGGPSLLGRGDNPSVLRGAELPPIRPYIGATGIYDSNNRSGYIGGPSLGSAYGVVGSFGVAGDHHWSHSELDLEYHGSYRNYIPHSDQNGFDHTLNFTFKHQLTPHLSLSLTESLSDVRNFYDLPISSLYGGQAGSNPLYGAIAGSTLTTTPSLASVGGVRLTYQLSARLSVSAGGSGIVSRQKLAGGTIGSDGWVASGDIAYRLTRYQTASVGYSFTHFDYSGRYGTTDIHTLNLGYSLRVGRNWEVALSGGVSRSEILGEVLDPALAELLGVPFIFIRTYTVSYTPIGTALITRSFRHASWSASFDHLELGAGSLYGASTYEHGGSDYTYSGLRRLSLSVGGGYYRFLAFGQSEGGYHALGISGGFGVHMGMGFSWVGRIDWRDYAFGNSQHRNSYYATLGIAWRPGHAPVSLW